MNKEELIDELTGSIIGYIMKTGVFPQNKLTELIKPKELAERYNKFENLIDLHFILKEEIVEFVSDLPNNLRNIKTQTKNISRTKHGITEGRINWEKTIQKRYSENPKDSSLFVCDNRTEHYDIPENLVLKKLLSIIYHTLKTSEDLFDENPSWLTKRWETEKSKETIDKMKMIFERNVHVNRIRQPEKYEPTERMIFTAKNSRSKIYRDAGEHLELRNEIQNKNEEELKKLLEDTALIPKDEETLFEMYVLFRFILELFEIYENKKVEFEEIRTGKEEIARYLGEKEVVLYHNNSARDRNIKFKSEVESKSYNELSRTEKVQKRSHEIMNEYFTKKSFSNHTKRPDIIMLQVESEEGSEYKYLITEIKNSSEVNTIRRGVKETLEYLAFLKSGTGSGEFVYPGEDHESCFGGEWNGLLVIQDLDDTSTLDIESQEDIKILQASEVKEKLNRMIEEVIQTPQS